MTQWSLNEIEGLLTKAARGAGAPPAQAAAFGKAGALFLANRGNVDVLNAALSDMLNGVILEYPAKLQKCLAAGGGVLAATPTELLSCYAQILSFRVTTVQAGLHIDMEHCEKARAPNRISLDANVLAPWRALAAKTLVPDTDQSRQSGAGAGLEDND